MKALFITMLILTSFSLGFYYGGKIVSDDAVKIINQLDVENQNLQYQFNQCKILYRGQ
jgi:hypothetical protein